MHINKRSFYLHHHDELPHHLLICQSFGADNNNNNNIVHVALDGLSICIFSTVAASATKLLCLTATGSTAQRIALGQ